ncbi:hypothetical protein [Streptomyces swartbergensis]|uniref:hypothetical protein n=1 Tax=Streptomyces swartbergensis TaxID=487165 RepID=UPI0013024FD2|nr:hypothetical protein [Streptomyces swartbergensis]
MSRLRRYRRPGPARLRRGRGGNALVIGGPPAAARRMVTELPADDVTALWPALA